MKTSLAVWLRALRLKFYPMSWVAYAVGALLAAGTPALGSLPFWSGLAFLFFLEVATVLSNEYVDFASDRVNRHASAFSGGSRVLVDGALSFRQLGVGIVVALALSVVCALAVLATTRGTLAASALLVTVLTLLAVGYTVPPLKLSYRTLGELDVGITNSIGVMMCGYVFAGGHWADPLPWLLSLPLGLAFLPSITLSAVPDHDADRQAGKRSIAVRFGIRGAMRAAQGSALLAAASAVWLEMLVLPGIYGPAVWLAVVHALWLIRRLQHCLKAGAGVGRIDRLMVMSLTFVIWFGVLPLLRLLA